MIDIINGLGRLINDTTRMMYNPNQYQINYEQPTNLNHTPCTNCGNGMSAQIQQDNPNPVIFNAEKQISAPSYRKTGEVISEPNMRDIPYSNVSGLKFN